MAKTEVDANSNEMADSKPQNDNKKDVSLLDSLASLKQGLMRGGTPENIEQRCLDLCQTYIGGSWNQAKSIDDVEVKRISGGVTNQLYKVALKESVQTTPDGGIYRDEPRVVAIKLYQPKLLINFNNDETERLNDTIVLTLLSEVNIGPKVYGIFNDGFIQAFHEHEQFRPKHQQNPKLLRELANLIARTNYLNVPLRKNNNWFMDEMRCDLEEGLSNSEVLEAVKELNFECLGKCDLREEFDQFVDLIKQINPPRVFCHNDLRGSNILVDCLDQSIRLVDLEYSSYGYRGHDLGAFLMEWDRELFDFQNIQLPSDSVLENFIKLYIEACDRIVPGYSTKPENSIKKILTETKLFILGQFMFFTTFFLKQNESFIDGLHFDRKANLGFVETNFKSYLENKEKFLKECVLESD